MSAYLTAFKSIKLSRHALILDIGCGSGSYTRILSGKGYRVAGIDYAWKVAAEAKKRSVKGKEEYLCGNLYNLPFADNTFEHIVCIGVFQSVMRFLDALMEINRILAPGALLFVMTLNSLEIINAIKRIFKKDDNIFINGRPEPRLKTYSPQFFKKQLVKTGFCNISLKPVQILPEFMSKASKPVERWNKLPLLPYLTARSFMIQACKIAY